MATLNLEITDAPQNLVAELSLAAGREYVVQNTGATAFELYEGAQMTAQSHGFWLRPGQTWALTPGTDPVWASTGGGGNSRAIVQET